MLNDHLPEGYHTGFDLSGCNYDSSRIRSSVKHLVKVIGATPINGKFRVIEGPDMMRAIALLKESHIEVTAMPDPMNPGKTYVAVNVYTCGKEASPDVLAPKNSPTLFEEFRYGHFDPAIKGKSIRNRSVTYPRTPGICTDLEEELRNERPGRHVIFSADGCGRDLYGLRVEDWESVLLEAAGIRNGQYDSFKHQFEPAPDQKVGGSTLVVASDKLVASLHSWPEFRFAAMDFVSYNGPLDPASIARYLVRELQPQKVDLEVLQRGTKAVKDITDKVPEFVGVR